MADSSDVANELVSLVNSVVYPNGTSAPSIVGCTVGIERGWPIPDELQSQLDAGQCIVSIFAPPGMERNTTRYPRDDEVLAEPVHTLSASVAGNQVTIGGSFSASTPQNVAVICGKLSFVYSCRSGDALNSIAGTLAALIAEAFPGTAASGAVITIAGSPGTVQARIGGMGQIWTEQRRQEKVFWITCWCFQPAIRDALASDIDVALSQLDFITLSDNSAARIIYNSARESDEGEKNEIYRRDLLYSVEYPTTTITSLPETMVIGATLSVSGVDEAVVVDPLAEAPSLDFSQSGNSQYLPAV